jgi:riboflavin-specific deaminase-like protein
LPRPFVTANFAITADGRISTSSLVPGNFSSATDKLRLLEIRARADAVLVGARTLAADKMTLRVPAAVLRRAGDGRGMSHPPLRVIVSNSGRIDPALRIFEAPGAPILIFTTRRMPAATRSTLAQRAEVFIHESAAVSLPLTLAVLRQDYGVKRLVCEGGGTLLHAFAAAGLLDELHLTICPVVFGGRRSPTLTGIAHAFLPRSTSLRLVEMQPIGTECFTRWRVVRNRQGRRHGRGKP